MPQYSEFEDFLLDHVVGVSYIGAPKNNTMVYMTRKIEAKIACLANAQNCLVFVEQGVEIPAELLEMHNFVICADPPAEYTKIAQRLAGNQDDAKRKRHYTITEGMYYIGENVKIGKGTYVEPGAFLDHDVIIGSDSTILSGARIRSGTIIGDRTTIGENSAIGDYPFNVAYVSDDRSEIIPAFGKTLIGSDVYIGSEVSISRSVAGETIIEDCVKIDSSVKVGHDAHLHKLVEVRGGSALGGYIEIGERTIVGSGATLKNRIIIGRGCFIGMGSVVQHNVRDGLVVSGSPAITLEQIGRDKAMKVILKKICREYNN